MRQTLKSADRDGQIGTEPDRQNEGERASVNRI